MTGFDFKIDKIKRCIMKQLYRDTEIKIKF